MPSTKAPSPASRRLRVSLGPMLLAAAAALASGCGADEYQRQLSESVKLMEYYALLDDHLSKSPWSDSGIELRPPKQFGPLPAPAPLPEGQTSDAPPPPDPRQPRFFANAAVLPGMAGAWEAQVTGLVGGASRPLPAWMYVLTNYSLWLDSTTHEQAAAFHDEVVNQLCRGLNASSPREADWKPETFPQGRAYLPKKSFLQAELNPRPVIEGVEYDVSIYLHQAGDIRVAVLFLTPQGADFKVPGAGDALRLSLETLAVSDQRPGRGALDGGGATGQF